jgi:LysR family glycine cleavage system transcriptional activator
MAGRLPSLRGIETFICVAEVLNFRVASERLNVTVSAISHRIQSLEQDLGFPLFDRGHRRLRLTEEGTALLARLRPGVRLLEEATRITREKASRPLVRVSAPPLFNAWLLSQLGTFHALHPDVSLELLSFGRRRSASVDVSIGPLTAVAQRDGAALLVPIRITPICSPAFLAAHPITSPADLLTLPLIDTVPNLKGWEAWFLAAGIDQDVPTPRLVLDNQALIYQAVMEGQGLAIGMRSLVAEYVARGLIALPIDIECDFGPALGILLNEDGNIRPARAFARWLHDRMGENRKFVATPVQKN